MPESRLIIETLWGVRKGESVPELMAAWDEYSIDQYREGWSEECQKAITSWGSDLDQYRYIEVVVDLDKIERAFESPTIEALYSQVGDGPDYQPPVIDDPDAR